MQYQPKVYQQKGNTLVDVTKSVLVANGSIGQMSVDVYEGKMGTFARLKNVLVTKLIEYIKPDSAGGNPGSEFGMEVVSSDNEEQQEQQSQQSQPKQAAKSASKPASKKAVPALDEDDLDDSPF